MRAKAKADRLCSGLIEAGWLGALILLPLVFNAYSDTRYEPDKVVLLRSITAMMLGAWIVKAVLGAAWSRRAKLAAIVKLPFVPAISMITLAYAAGGLRTRSLATTGAICPRGGATRRLPQSTWTPRTTSTSSTGARTR